MEPRSPPEAGADRSSQLEDSEVISTPGEDEESKEPSAEHHQTYFHAQQASMKQVFRLTAHAGRNHALHQDSFGQVKMKKGFKSEDYAL